MPAHTVTTADHDRSPYPSERRFTAGHLGELTQLLPFEMVDAALDETNSLQKRLRELPSRVVVYLLLAGCLFPEAGYTGVWRKLTAGLSGLRHARPSASALSQARRRLGAGPLRWLFNLLRGPVGSAPSREGVWFKNLLVTAVDGTILTVPDADGVRRRYTKQSGNHGGTGYPQVRLLALVACGTRSIIDAVFGPTTTGETTYFPRLLGAMKPGMIVLADRNFDAHNVVTAIAATGADFLIRGKTTRKLPVLARNHDGSYTSRIGQIRVRVIDAEVTITTATGRQQGSYRLITTLDDPLQYPASQLVDLYHQRWEIETSYLELKSSMLGGRVLRARTAEGIDQEIYALLITYQLLRTVISDATYDAGIDPDRGSFSITFQAARDQVVLATRIISETVIDLVGVIGGHVQADPLPQRRLRVCPRIVKQAISKYQARGPNIDRTCRTARIDIDILTGAPP